MGKFLSFLLLLSSVVILTKVVTGDVFRDYFEVIMDRFEVVKETREILSFDIKVRKVNKVRSLVGNVTYIVPYDENFYAEIKILKKQGGEYRYTPYRVLRTLGCDLIEKDIYAWPDILKGSNIPPGCPIPVGRYTWYNVSFSFNSIPKGMCQSGEYCGEISFYKGQELFAIYKIYTYINLIG